MLTEFRTTKVCVAYPLWGIRELLIADMAEQRAWFKRPLDNRRESLANTTRVHRTRVPIPVAE